MDNKMDKLNQPLNTIYSHTLNNHNLTLLESYRYNFALAIFGLVVLHGLKNYLYGGLIYLFYAALLFLISSAFVTIIFQRFYLKELDAILNDKPFRVQQIYEYAPFIFCLIGNVIVAVIYLCLFNLKTETLCAVI
jgi:ABC-type sugar transport system permease subunit